MKGTIYHLVVLFCIAIVPFELSAKEIENTKTPSPTKEAQPSAEPSPMSTPSLEADVTIETRDVIDPQNSDVKANEKKTEVIERAVMPVTRWIEEKIHNAYKTGSTSPHSDHAKQPGLSLREAIDLARKEHGGTVLSADRIDQQGAINYRVKILSKGGVIKMVDIFDIPAVEKTKE